MLLGVWRNQQRPTLRKTIFVSGIKSNTINDGSSFVERCSLCKDDGYYAKYLINISCVSRNWDAIYYVPAHSRREIIQQGKNTSALWFFALEFLPLQKNYNRKKKTISSGWWRVFFWWWCFSWSDFFFMQMLINDYHNIILSDNKKKIKLVLTQSKDSITFEPMIEFICEHVSWPFKGHLLL